MIATVRSWASSDADPCQNAMAYTMIVVERRSETLTRVVVGSVSAVPVMFPACASPEETDTYMQTEYTSMPGTKGNHSGPSTIPNVLGQYPMVARPGFSRHRLHYFQLIMVRSCAPHVSINLTCCCVRYFQLITVCSWSRWLRTLRQHGWCLLPADHGVLPLLVVSLNVIGRSIAYFQLITARSPPPSSRSRS